MAQLFSRSSDTLFRSALVGSGGFVCFVVAAMMVLARSPYMTNQGVTVPQEVPFSHLHHVGEIGIDCRYCHQTVEVSARAGIPSTQVCMNCHRKLWNQADMLAPVRTSYREDIPLRWNRVHDLPDYVYFNHSIHVHQGVGCYECHGRVDEMPLVSRARSLTMQWCLECHGEPVPHLRPAEFIFDPKPLEELMPEADVADARERVAAKNHVESKRNCYTCHR